MYAQHFGLQHEPFSIAPDPRYLFMSERHREALAHLLYGVNGGGGFVLLTGEIGAGKTTVCRCFLEQIPKRCNVAYIFNPKLSATELLRTVCDEFRIPYHHEGPGQPTVKDLVDPLNAFLLATHAVGQNNLLIIDEAQNLAPEVLEQLRLLTNLETSERKLLQVILIGQPELRAMLARPELEQLAQRVIARFHLDTLTEDETQQYIAHRLAVAGARHNIFDRAAARRVHRWSRGVPRRINLLCDRALLGAYGQGKARVDKATVDKAAREVFDDSAPPAATLVPGSAHGVQAGWGPGGARQHAWLLAAVAAVGGAAASAWITGRWAQAPAPAAALAAGTQASPGRPGSAATMATDAANAAGTGSKGAPEVADARTGAQPGPRRAEGGASAQEAPIGQPALKMSPAPAITGGPALLGTAQLPQGVPAPLGSEREAWQVLLPLWGVTPGGESPCLAAARRQVQCFGARGGLPLLRQLGRPALLTLQDEQGRPRYAVVTALGPSTATLSGGGTTRTVGLDTLSALWRGDLTTLWRTPPGFERRLREGDTGPAVDWLGATVAAALRQPPPAPGRAFDAELKARLQSFQAAQGLTPDGVAGAVTLMQLNRAAGLQEPRLKTGK